jgi:hypothetical protein
LVILASLALKFRPISPPRGVRFLSRTSLDRSQRHEHNALTGAALCLVRALHLIRSDQEAHRERVPLHFRQLALSQACNRLYYALCWTTATRPLRVSKHDICKYQNGHASTLLLRWSNECFEGHKQAQHLGITAYQRRQRRLIACGRPRHCQDSDPLGSRLLELSTPETSTWHAIFNVVQWQPHTAFYFDGGRQAHVGPMW